MIYGIIWSKNKYRFMNDQEQNKDCREQATSVSQSFNDLLSK